VRHRDYAQRRRIGLDEHTPSSDWLGDRKEESDERAIGQRQQHEDAKTVVDDVD
jgi:hypothetical protein